MNYLQLLKKNKVKVDELPYELQSQIGDYNLGLEKVQEAESLDLGQEDLQALNEQKEQLSELHSQIKTEIEAYLLPSDKETSTTQEEPKKRGRKPKVKDTVVEQKIPAKRGRKPRQEVDPILEVAPVIELGVEPKEEATVVEVKETENIRGRKQRLDDVHFDEKLAKRRAYLKEQSELSEKSKPNAKILSIESSDEIEDDYEDSKELEVKELQNEIAGEFDRVEKISSNKRKFVWGIGLILSVGIAAFCGVQILKESK